MSEQLTKAQAADLRARYAAHHPVTRGFWPGVSDAATDYACANCGRLYLTLGTKPKCYTCGGQSIVPIIEEEPATPQETE